jgi:hypothetical protein
MAYQAGLKSDYARRDDLATRHRFWAFGIRNAFDVGQRGEALPNVGEDNLWTLDRTGGLVFDGVRVFSILRHNPMSENRADFDALTGLICRLLNDDERTSR